MMASAGIGANVLHGGGPPAGRPPRRRLGVIGTVVWDVIYGRDARRTPVEEWGGITYALSALDAALPDAWEIVPLIKVGHDLAVEARRYFGTLRRMAPDAAPIEVPYPNNRVELRYFSSERRSEILSGGVPPWSWLGLKPLLEGLDALYVNLISGFELELETAQLIRRHFRGPIYCDLHSLLLAVQPDGLRTPRPLPNAADWFACFDLLQVNEDEMALMAPDPLALAATALAAGVRSLVVTLGPRGAVYFAAPGFDGLAVDATGRATVPATVLADTLGPVRTALVPADAVPATAAVDPTGCGDVWGATYFSRLLAGDNLADAMRAAHRAAARNVEHRGATGLASHLRGELSRS
ncbi:MAG TPA: carbohydrate kinase family protein [Gemmatimonadaceae bacterium]|nr:carbohydrate kinase family protein [Gemmatimonadaceae bacterium]